MSAVNTPSRTTPPPGSSPRSSAAPLLSEPKAPEEEQSGLLAKGKRKLLALGKKKEGDKQDSDKPTEPTATHTRTMSPISAPTLLPSPPLTTSPPDRRASPRGSPRIYPAGVGASPNRRIARSSSPGLHSPASSQIFERNVQEPEPSPAIPAHIKTEDHIPPALDASTEAITTDLNPDEVEIIMHSAHQPAAAAVAASVTDSVYSPSLAHEEAVFSHPDLAESVSNSNYGSLDTTDVRRLSFISFADVVQAEHAETDRDASMQFMSLSSTANRSPSPVRSPASSHGFSASPPTSGAASEKGAEFVSAKGTRTPGSPTHGTQSPPLGGGELQIETMRQALRRTGSGDLSGARSQPLSAVSIEDAVVDQPPFK